MTRPKPLPSQEKLLHLFLYDGVNLVWKNPYWKRHLGKIAGTMAPDGYLVVQIEGEQYKVHRVIYKMIYGEEPEQIDHDNRNRSDNVLDNILPSDGFKNKRNTSMTKRKDLPRGVDLFRGKYRASIHAHGRTIAIGVWSSPDEASSAFERAYEERKNGDLITVYRICGTKKLGARHVA